MHAYSTRFRNAIVTACLLSSIGQALPQSDEPWTDKQLKDPAVLAAAIAD